MINIRASQNGRTELPDALTTTNTAMPLCKLQEILRQISAYNLEFFMLHQYEQ